MNHVKTALLLGIAFFLLLATSNNAVALSYAANRQPLNLTPEQVEKLVVIPKSGDSVDGQNEQPYIQIDDMRFQVSRDEPKATSAFSGNKWTDGIVYYQFDPNVSPYNRQRFINAAQEWSNVADLTFKEGFGNGNYIEVFSGTGNWSYVGMTGNRQYLSIISWSSKYIIVHEIGHALGLLHEQSRSDRDDYVNIIWSNIQGGTGNINFQKNSSTDYGPYDFYSVMHYSPYAFALVQGTITIEPKPAYAQYFYVMGQHSYLSELDKAGMAAHYGLPIRLTFSPASLDFEAVLLGSSDEQQLVIQNNGDDQLSGTISISAPFSVISSETYSLANGATQHVTVCYQPTAEIPSSTALYFSSGESINVNGRGVSNNDDDGDGATNYEEEIAGTSKSNPFDVFKISPVSINTNNIATFSISTKNGRSYQLQATHNIVYIPWYNIGEEVIGDGSTTNLTALSNKNSIYFRVIVNKND